MNSFDPISASACPLHSLRFTGIPILIPIAGEYHESRRDDAMHSPARNRKQLD